jgi:hypothetical protein
MHDRDGKVVILKEMDRQEIFEAGEIDGDERAAHRVWWEDTCGDHPDGCDVPPFGKRGATLFTVEYDSYILAADGHTVINVDELDPDYTWPDWVAE